MSIEALVYFLVWGVAIFLMLRFGCGAHVMGHSPGKDHEHGAADKGGRGLRWIAPERATDPVCGKSVQTTKAKPSVFDGYVYYFCSRDCREIFEAAPQTYVSEGKPLQESEEVHHAG